jgi:cytochrome b pre-mRNA-processing protein 3
MILKRFQPNPSHRSIDELYGAIVAQARSMVFYTAYGIPDTLEGALTLSSSTWFCCFGP